MNKFKQFWSKINKTNKPFDQMSQQELADSNDFQRKLEEAHMAEADRKGVKDFYNMGWATGADFIHSKTDKGRLLTEYKDGKFTHEWDTSHM